MNKYQGIDLHEILRALEAGPSNGLLGAELRTTLTGPPASKDLNRALSYLEQQSRVSRDRMTGRWTLNGAAPPAQARGATSKAPKTVEPRAQGEGGQKPQTVASKVPPAALLPVVNDPGIPPRDRTGHVQLDPTQRPVALAPAGARQVVEAGPGYGKTAVACARVAHLLEQGVPGNQILLLSFTRTAVREMRQRIAAMAQGGVDVWDLRVQTLDSWAWQLRSTFESQISRSVSYGQSVEIATHLLAHLSGDLAYSLESLQHVLIDEAQDLVGPRASLVAALLRALSPACGFTVFLDPAQAIYDWSDDGGPEGRASLLFTDLLRPIPGIQDTVALGYLHRTAEPSMRRLLLGARALVLDPTERQPAQTLHRHLLTQVPDDWPGWAEVARDLPPDALVLFRRRGAALNASAWLASQGIRHRLRIGAHPQPVAPWVAALLQDAVRRAEGATLLSREDCEQAWVPLQGSYLTRGWSFDAAWRALRQLSAEGRTRIEAQRVADALITRRVPDDLLTRELGPEGPVLGTVHGSKGREADQVVFMLPRAEELFFERKGESAAEREERDRGEARVLYVAITRARERLDLLDSRRAFWRKIRDRDWTFPRRSDGDMRRKKEGDQRIRVRFEVGREGDLDIAGAMLLCPGGPDEHQRWCRTFDGQPALLEAKRQNHARSDSAWEVQTCSHDDASRQQAPVVALLNPTLDRDLSDALSESRHTRASNLMLHLYQLDICSLPVSEEHPLLDQLPDPWRSLRLVLAPVVVGLGTTYSKRKTP